MAMAHDPSSKASGASACRGRTDGCGCSALVIPLGQHAWLIHWTPSNASGWARMLASPPAGMYLAAVERPGFGAIEPRHGVLSLKEQASALPPVLERSRTPVILVGHSIGASIASSGAVMAKTVYTPTTSPNSMESWHALVADTNGDDVVNILDFAPPGADATLPIRGAGLERLVAELPDGGIPSVPTGESMTFQIRFENSTTPLFGYSLGISMQPQPGSGGESIGVADESSFFIEQNLIAGDRLHNRRSVQRDPRRRQLGCTCQRQHLGWLHSDRGPRVTTTRPITQRRAAIRHFQNCF